MKRALIAAALAGVSLTAAGIGLANAAQSGAVAAAQTPVKVDNFQLTDQTLMAYELYYYKYAPAVVLMSHASGTAYSKTAAAELEKLNAAYKAKGVLVLMIDSTAGR